MDDFPFLGSVLARGVGGRARSPEGGMVARNIGATIADLNGWRDQFSDGGD